MIPQPYPGLRPFNRDEDEIFFGRESHVNQLLDKLADAHFIAVLGTSGSGKSSLVRAGLLPALDGGFMAGGGARWAVAELRPGDKPFHYLASALVKETKWGRAFAVSAYCQTDKPFERNSTIELHQDDPELSKRDKAISILEQDLRRGSMALNWRVGVQPLPDDTRLLILVDQFEELFRYEKTAGVEAGAFVALLLATATHPDVYVVITMRSEFLGDCARFPELPEAINAGLFLTPRLSPEQMADAIQLPARLYGGEVTADLANRLLKDARGEMDQLPLLQHALMRLWHRKTSDGQLTLTELTESGGLRKALNDHAEEAFNELDAEQQKIAEIMFRALTERGPAERDTRRPVPLEEIQELAQVSPDELDQVVEVFRRGERSFLNTTANTLDISHEALIRQWERLHDWTADEFKQAELYQRLEASAQRQKEGKGALWIDPDLQYALEWREKRDPNSRWARRYGGDFELAMRFLDASLEERRNQEKRREERRLKELKRSNRIALAFLVALITLALSGWALFERQHAKKSEAAAKRHAEIAEQREILAKNVEQERTENLFDASLTHATLLAQVGDPAEARNLLRKTIKLDQSISGSRRHARNLLAGYVVYFGGEANKTFEGPDAPILDVAVSPNGQLLAAAGERATLLLFDTETGKQLKRLEGHTPGDSTFGAVKAVVFNAQGDTLYSGGADKQIIRWGLPNGEIQKIWSAPEEVWEMALSPDGKILASGGKDDVITLWHTSTGEKKQTLTGRASSIADSNTLAFSPDGQWLISGSFTGDVAIWNVASGQETALPKMHTEKIHAVAISPDRQWIATGGEDNHIILWNAQTFRPVNILRGHTNMVKGLVFDADSQHLFSSSSDRTIRYWEVASGKTFRISQGHTAGLWTVTRHENTLYTASDDGTIRRWATTTPVHWVWERPSESPISIAISPEGKLLAVGYDDGAIRIFELMSGKLLLEKQGAHKDLICRVAFNPEGTRLATASFDSLAKIWGIEHDGVNTNLTLIHTLRGHTNGVNAVEFSPDGRTIATAGYDGKVGLFNSTSGAGEFIEAHEQRVANVSFSADGKRMLSAGIRDFKLRLWNLESNPPSFREIGETSDRILWAALRPDGLQVVAGGRNQVISIYDMGSKIGPPRTLVGHERAVLRVIYSPDGTQLATVCGDTTVRLWDLVTGKAMFSINLPTHMARGTPLWDFDFQCTPDGNCWIAVPLTMGRLALYRLPYENPPKSISDPPPPN